MKESKALMLNRLSRSAAWRRVAFRRRNRATTCSWALAAWIVCAAPKVSVRKALTSPVAARLARR